MMTKTIGRVGIATVAFGAVFMSRRARRRTRVRARKRRRPLIVAPSTPADDLRAADRATVRFERVGAGCGPSDRASVARFVQREVAELQGRAPAESASGLPHDHPHPQPAPTPLPLRRPEP